MAAGEAAWAAQKITVQGVIRRSGTTATDALINNVAGASSTVLLRCVACGGGGTDVDYNSTSTTIVVKNGAFIVSVEPDATSLAAMAASPNAEWQVVIDGQLDPDSASLTFPIRIEYVPFAHVAKIATLAKDAEKLQGLTVDVTAQAEGRVLKLRSGKIVFDADDNSGGGGGTSSVNYAAGSGILISGTTIAVDPANVAMLTTGRISSSALPATIPMANLSLAGVSGLVQLTAGKIPSGYLDSTSFAAGSINGRSPVVSFL
jgi:hypothetical protein